MLSKWKKEREEKRREEAMKKKPLFKVTGVKHSLSSKAAIFETKIHAPAKPYLPSPVTKPHPPIPVTKYLSRPKVYKTKRFYFNVCYFVCKGSSAP